MKKKHNIEGITKESFGNTHDKLTLLSWPWTLTWQACGKLE